MVVLLQALADKIDLNRRMNETLEEMARALFKDWFVDFGPTKVKMEGRAPYLEADQWALFPERLDGERKPEGWKLGCVKDLFVLQRGFDLPVPKRTAGPYPVMAASGPHGTHHEYMVRGPGVTTGRSGVLGNVFLLQEDFWPLNTSLWVKDFVKATPVYAYFLLQEIDVGSYNAGSAVPTLNRNHIQSLPAVLPSPEVIAYFDESVMPMFKRQKRNDEETRTLSQIRDLLLPKLMSGEVRVADAEQIVAEVL